MQAYNFFNNHQKTPKSIKYLLWITALVSLLTPLVSFLLHFYFHSEGPNVWLALSRYGLLRGWLWEPLTYFFLHSPAHSITLPFLISLFFQLLLFWFTASDIFRRFGETKGVIFYLSAGVIPGLIASVFLVLFSQETFITGNHAALGALLICWSMLYPDLELTFFLLIRIKAKWLVALYLGLTLILRLSYGEWISFAANLSGILWGFLIGRFVWKLNNPFPLNLDIPRKKTKQHQGKIIDISVLQDSDTDFMDRMLEKISKEGEHSLSKRERERMKKISERKRKSGL